MGMNLWGWLGSWALAALFVLAGGRDLQFAFVMLLAGLLLGGALGAHFTRRRGCLAFTAGLVGALALAAASSFLQPWLPESGVLALVGLLAGLQLASVHTSLAVLSMNLGLYGLMIVLAVSYGCRSVPAGLSLVALGIPVLLAPVLWAGWLRARRGAEGQELMLDRLETLVLYGGLACLLGPFLLGIWLDALQTRYALGCWLIIVLAAAGYHLHRRGS